MYFQDHIKNTESIVVDTQTEYNRYEETNIEIETIKRKLFLFNIAKMLNNRQYEFSYVEVRAYRGIQEVEEISIEHIPSRTPEDSSVFVIDIIIPKFLHVVFLKTELIVNICIFYGKTSISKTFPLNGSTAMKEIVTLSGSSKNCKVNIIFFGKIDGKNVTFNTKSIDIDISYHLISSSNLKRNEKCLSIEEKIVRLGTLYNIRYNKKSFTEHHLKYKIYCSLGLKELIELILKNCYTFINVNSFICDEKSKLHIENDELNIFIMYDLEKNIFQLKAGLYVLLQVKKYLIDELDLNLSVEKANIQKLGAFKVCDYNAISETYRALRNICLIEDI